MDYHYEILPKGKQHGLYRLEWDGTAILLAYADDTASRLRLSRMKTLFEEEPIALDELHAAAALSLTAPQTNKPSWGPVGLVGGGMEVWDISEVQTAALKRVRETEGAGLHKSVLNIRTVDVLLRHSLVRERRSCSAYLTLSEKGNDLLKRIER